VPTRYRDKRVERFEAGEFVKAFSGFERQIERRLRVFEAATSLDDLRSIPGHRLEALVDDRAGQYSIRINDQYRTCFVWPDDQTGALEIEVTDYHK
jgi:proteic killer suppression protein